MNSYFKRKKQRNKYRGLNDNAKPNRSSYSAFDRTLDSESGSVVYVFNDETEHELVQVQTTNDASRPASFVEKEVRDKDTLVGLALRYGVTVAELKRVNNIFSNQELYGLRKVKVPVKPFSILTELKEEGEQASASPVLNGDEQENVQVRTLAIGQTESFLRHMDEDLQRIRKATCQYKSSLEEVAAELTCKRFYPLTERGKSSGIQLRCLLTVGALIILIIPVAIIVYVELLKDKH